MRYSLFFIGALLSNAAMAQLFPLDDAQPRKLYIDQDSLFVDLKFEPAEGVVHGEVDIFFSPTHLYRDTLVFDATNMSSTGKITLDGSAVEGEFSKTELRVYMPSLNEGRHHIHIPYSAKPTRGMYFMGWDRADGNGFIYTQGQGIDNRRWVPHVDAQNDKLKSTIRLTFDAEYTAVANGLLIGEIKNQDGTITKTYAMLHPHSSYLMAVAIGKYEVIKANYSGVPQEHYVYPDRKEFYASTYRGSETIFNYLQKRFGVEYPWGVYRQVPVENFPHGAMENTTLTIFSDVFLSDANTQEILSYTYVNAHELVHHWFGDMVTAPSGHDFWLQEGFATYFQWRAEEQVLGVDRFEEELIRAKFMVEAISKRDTFPVRHSKAGSERFYQKGGYVLRMLELKMGRSDFDAMITNYLNKHKYGLVVTDDLLREIELQEDASYSDFFDAWIEQPGEPVFEFAYQLSENKSRSGRKMQTVEYSLQRVDKWPVDYPISLPIRWKLLEGERWDTIVWKGKEYSGSFEVPNDLTVEYAAVDPHQTMLMKVKVQQSAGAWGKQLLMEPTAGGQWNAAMSMHSFENSAIIESALEYLKRSDGRMAVRSELVKVILSKNPDWLDKYAEDILHDLDESAWNEVAKAMESTSKKTDATIAGQIPNLTEMSAESILMKLSIKRADMANDYFEKAEGIAQVRGHHIAVLQAALGFYLGIDDKQRSIEKLKTLAGVEYDDMTRSLAWQYLYLIAPTDSEWPKGLIDGLINSRRSIRKPAQDLLKQWLNDKERGEWILSYLRHTAKVRSDEDRRIIETLLKIEL